MAKYINADELKQKIPETKEDIFENCRYCSLLDKSQACEIIDEMPAADVVEVVRCKDCKYAILTNKDETACFCSAKDILLKANHYCSFAERKEDENE